MVSLSVTDELVSANRSYAQQFEKGDLPMPPARHVAVVTCMDARLVPARFLGLEEGDAHVISNAGGRAQDALRSLVISQRLLGTNEVAVIHHTDCGMLTFQDDEFRRQIQEEVGIKSQWAPESFADLEEDVRQSKARIEASPFVPRKDSIRGFIYDVDTGRLQEIS